jgi:hypothetical protein
VHRDARDELRADVPQLPSLIGAREDDDVGQAVVAEERARLRAAG